jgi:hypothetical protein
LQRSARRALRAVDLLTANGIDAQSKLDLSIVNRSARRGVARLTLNQSTTCSR